MEPADFQEVLFRVISQIIAAISSRRLYDQDHPQIKYYIGKAYKDLSNLLQSEKEVTLFIVGNDLVANNRAFKTGDPFVEKLIRTLKEKNIGHVTFRRGLPIKDFRTLISSIGSVAPVSIRSTDCIKLGSVVLEKEKKEEKEVKSLSSPDISQEEFEALSKVSDVAFKKAANIYTGVTRNRQLQIQGVDDVIKDFLVLFKRNVNPLSFLAVLKSSDEYTFTHAVNVGILTISQARSLGFPENYLPQIGSASFLHDVGKLFIPDEILNKPGMLTPDERLRIETHAFKGANYLMARKEVPKLAILTSLEHHIKYDGTGYPQISSGWRPNIVSQMITISDVFDAMRSRRIYKEVAPPEVIIKILQDEKGTSFNPRLVDNFVDLISRQTASF